jgi:hypothetical protein
MIQINLLLILAALIVIYKILSILLWYQWVNILLRQRQPSSLNYFLFKD